MRVEPPRMDEFPYRECPHPLHHIRSQLEDTGYEPKNNFSPDAESSSTLILDFQPPEL